MKKLISVIVAVVMVLSTVSAFAAVEVNTSSPSMNYINTFAGISDSTGTAVGSTPSVKGNIGFNKDHPANFEFKDEKLIVTRPTINKDSNGNEIANTKTALTYLYFQQNSEQGTTDDIFAFGFDVKFSGITSNSDTSVLSMLPGRSGAAFTDEHQAGIDSGKWYVGSDGKVYKTADNSAVAASKTSWCFRKSGDGLAFATKNADEGLVLGENDQAAIFFGSAQLEQDKFYTLKVYVNQNTKKYYAVIIDENGNVMQTGVDGVVQNAFENLVKADMQFKAGMNAEASVTFDNIFCDGLEFAVTAPVNFEPNEDGTVSFSAAIPDDITEPKVYINDTFVENVTTEPHKTDYSITSQLPEGTTLGDVKIEIRGMRGGEEVSASAVTSYAKVLVKPITIGYDEKKITGYDENGIPYYGKGDTRTKEIKPALVDGLYEVGAKVQRVEGEVHIRFRSNNYTNASGDYAAAGALINTTANDPWRGFNMGALGVKTGDTDWHDLKILIDYRESAFDAPQPFSISIDDNPAHVLTFKMAPDSTMNGFIEFGMYGVYYKEVYINEIIEVGAKSVVASYANETEATYGDEALLSVGMNKLTFALNTAIDSADAIKFVDASGNEVDGVTLSMNGSDITVTPDEGVAVPTGSYKLVIDKTATIDGDALGANLEVPVELNAPATIVAPAEGGTVITDKVNVVFYDEDVQKAVVYINDEKVKTFETSADTGFYEFPYTPSKIGTNYVDVYMYKNGEVELVSSSFIWHPYEKYNVLGTGFSSSDWAPISGAQGFNAEAATAEDGGAAVKYTTKVDSGNRFVNLTFKSERATDSQRIGVREFDVKLDANTYINIELGVNATDNKQTSGTVSVVNPSGETVSVSNYPNPTDWPGTGGSSKALFAKDGTIAGSSYTWEADQWYHVKHVLDLENKVIQVYITNDKIGENVLVANMDISNHSIVKNVPDTVVNYSKYRIHVQQIDVAAGSASATFAKPMTYQLKQAPVAAVETETVIEGTDSVVVTLDKAYDALAADEIFVTVNGEDVAGAVAEISEDGKTITVSGLADVKAGTRLEIAVSSTCMFGGVPAGKETAATVFVANKDNVCILPLKLESEDGTDLLAFSKYINGSGNTLYPYLIMTEYEEGSAKRIKKVNFKTAEIKAGETGVVSGYFTGINSAQGCKVMLWNTDLSQLTEAENFTE